MLNTDWRLINMGPQLSRVHYTVDPAKAQLNSRNVNWADPGWPLPTVPLAQNVVLMKAQYGVDTNADNVIDCWTPADNANICGNGVDYSGPTDVTSAAPADGGPFATNANTARLRSIKAVRVAIVVRSEHQERPDPVFRRASSTRPRGSSTAPRTTRRARAGSRSTTPSSTTTAATGSTRP